MSRIGKKPISIPAGVEVQLTDTTIQVKGKLGTLTQVLRPELLVEQRDGNIYLTRRTDDKQTRSLHGLMRSLIQNMITGVSEGFSKTLELVGVGYRGQLQGTKLVLSLGFSHPVEIETPAGITFTLASETSLTISGYDKQQVGQMAAQIRAWRKPEPYKGKGVKYRDEVIIRKVGKKAAG